MSDVTKLPKWAQALLRDKDREISRLTNDVATLRKTVELDAPYGTVLLTGYQDEPLPIGRYFHVNIEHGRSKGLEVCLSNEGLEVRAEEGWVCAIPRVSNVMLMRKGGSVTLSNAIIPFAQNAPDPALDCAMIRRRASKVLHHITKAEGIREAGADDSGEMAEARRHLVGLVNAFGCFIEPMDDAAQSGVEGRQG